ncbi:MAG: PKD domain-containing protein [Candidatus Bipolaricaulota bacterium]|nr:PKD domain-containing protein [Candidatus Bipolaricaulota bacterium]MDW8031162.1 SdrD B-like domain-containing protein [Candidatus Bipolaricaulota bacterium]
MIRGACTGLTLAVLSVLIALAQGQPLELIAPPTRSALPGDIITLTFVAINRGTTSDTYLFSVEAPRGFQILGALPPITIAPGTQEPVFVTLLIAQETPAGTYTIGLEAVSQSDPAIRARAQTAITVEKTTGVIVRAPASQEVDPGAEVILTFSVTNRGNVIDAFRLDAFTPRGFLTVVEPRLVELLPGETRSVLVTVRIPQDASPGFEPVTLTAISLRHEGIQAYGAATLIILPPEAAKVPTALYLLAPAEFSVGANASLSSGALSSLISFLTYTTLPEEQRFSLKITVSDIVRSQIPSGLPISVKEFLFTSQRETFFAQLGDLPQSPLIYNLLPRRGVEVGFTDLFSLVATFEDHDGDFFQEQRAMALNFNGASVRASLARLSVSGATPYVLTAANFRSGVLSVEGAVAEVSAGLRRMVFLRAAPSFFGVTLGGEYLRVEPDFPSLISVPAVIADTQIWTLFGNGSIGALGVNVLVSGKRTDLFNDPAVQEITAITSQGRLVVRSFLPGWPSVFFDIKFISRRSNDPPFPSISTDEDIKSLTIADIASPVSYILTFQSNLFRDNLAPANNTDTFELISVLITRPLLGVEGLSLNLSVKSTFQVAPTTNTILDHQVAFIGRIAFTTARVSAFLLLGVNSNLLYPFLSSYFGSFSATLFGPVSTSFGFAFTEPSSLSFNIEIRTKFAMPFESVIIKGRVEGYLYIDINNNGQHDPGEPGVTDALLRLDNQLARTDAQGYFRFPPVDPGSYKVEIARAPLGLVTTVPTPIPVTVAIGQIVTLEIPMRSVGIIRGRVFDDKNRNGKPDPDERGLANVRVFAIGTTSAEVRSSADGQYLLQVSPGDYTVTVDRTTLPKRYELTTPPSVTVTVQTGQTVTVDFGAYEVPRPVLFAPIADFTFTPAQPRVGERVIFDASASTDSDGQIVRYEWDFTGDGTVDAMGKIVEWVFTSAGDFPVKLTVTDNDTLQNSITKIVPVRP